MAVFLSIFVPSIWSVGRFLVCIHYFIHLFIWSSFIHFSIWSSFIHLFISLFSRVRSDKKCQSVKKVSEFRSEEASGTHWPNRVLCHFYDLIEKKNFLIDNVIGDLCLWSCMHYEQNEKKVTIANNQINVFAWIAK